SPATAGRQVQRGEPSRQPPALPPQPPPPTQINTGRRLATASRQPRGMAAEVPRTASRPSRTARTDNGPDLTVKAGSQPGPGAQNRTICAQEFMLKTQTSAFP